MKQGSCTEMLLLIQADIDGELRPAEAARAATHAAACTGCTAAQAQLLALAAEIRGDALYHPTPEALRTAILNLVRSAKSAPTAHTRQSRMVPWARATARPWLGLLAPFGSGFAIAASLVLFLTLPGQADLTEPLVAGHIRALQPGHLLDVVSTDQHTVKPWFDGRLDFAPQVKDLAADGYPLSGARLDYMASRPVAALVYQRRQHVIDLFVWPDTRPSAAPKSTGRSGYNVLRWNRDGMVFWAVSDLAPQELAEFVRLWRAL